MVRRITTASEKHSLNIFRMVWIVGEEYGTSRVSEVLLKSYRTAMRAIASDFGGKGCLEGRTT